MFENVQLYGFPQAFFISKETPTEIGGRDILAVHKNEAMVA
jgi:hypothetical protein